MSKRVEWFEQQLHAFGIPSDFSVVPVHQIIPAEVVNEIARYIRVFEQVTTRPAWREVTLRQAPDIARQQREEVCFFSAWDLHLPPKQPHQWQLIEFNDNGSGFLFAGLINRAYYDLFLSGQDNGVDAPPLFTQLCRRIAAMIAAEAQNFFGRQPAGLLLILDDSDSLQAGKFRYEHQLLAKIAREQGWQTAICSPESLDWSGDQLYFAGKPVSFIINRSTDFLWQDDVFAPLHRAYRAGCVYVAPNPFSYTTRSDKRLLEYLSRPDWDDELGIQADERELLSRHTPSTYQLSEENLSMLADSKADYVFKPAHGHASLGVLDSHEVGRHRLMRLLAKGHHYVAQQVAEKSLLLVEANQPLWTDLRVWAYKGDCFLISGRASNTKERLDLRSPGGWLPTFQGD